MQILAGVLLQWDTKKQKIKYMGVLGTVLAFGPTDRSKDEEHYIHISKSESRNCVEDYEICCLKLI